MEEKKKRLYKKLYTQYGSIYRVAKAMKVCPQTAWENLNRIGVATNGSGNKWTDRENNEVKRVYENGFKTGDGTLDLLAKNLGRTKQFICRKAKLLGLTNLKRDLDSRLAKQQSTRMKKYIEKNGHAKGMLGKKHTVETLAIIGKKSREIWHSRTEEENMAIVDKSLKTRARNGTKLGFNRAKASWKQGWYEIGDKRLYFRSSWEFEYAKILEKRVLFGVIKSWDYEKDTFWFESIKRGVRSYCPDFKITNNDDTIEYHEIKGWMDARSLTKIKRMAKYYSHIKLRVIEGKEYKAIVKAGI